MNETQRWVDPSPEAITDKRINPWPVQYRSEFAEVPVGKSFLLPLSVGKLETIRSTVSRLFNKGVKKFKVVRHENCYEIHRKV